MAGLGLKELGGCTGRWLGAGGLLGSCRVGSRRVQGGEGLGGVLRQGAGSWGGQGAGMGCWG